MVAPEYRFLKCRIRKLHIIIASPFVIQKAMGHTDIKTTTMIYVDVAKPHIQEQVAKLDRIPLSPPLFA